VCRYHALRVETAAKLKRTVGFGHECWSMSSHHVRAHVHTHPVALTRYTVQATCPELILGECTECLLYIPKSSRHSRVLTDSDEDLGDI